MTEEIEKKLHEAIKRQAVDGKVSCKAMLELSAGAAASPKDIGTLCDEMNIRIRGCQLGCFE